VTPYAVAWHLETIVFVPALAVAYALVLQRFPVSRLRLWSFVGGEAVILLSFATPLETIALHYLLTAHLLQNVALAEWAPALLVLALPTGFARAAEHYAIVRALTHPLVALPLWLATYYVWHVPAIYDYALAHQESLLHVEHATYLAAGFLVWWPVFHGEYGSATKATYLFAAFVFGSPLGLLLALLPHAAYDFYADAPRLWGLTPLRDQQLAGLTMAAEQAVVFFAAFTYFFLRFLREEQAAGLVESR
jgi:cytochrome c oxidase assembly factor CtaG